MRAESIIHATELPRVVLLGTNLYGIVFSLMKLLPARFMLDRARDAGVLRPGSVVLESSSGTFGLALAMLCAMHGYRCILVGDAAIDSDLRRRLVDLGAEVHLVEDQGQVGGIQQARLDRLRALREAHPGHVWPAQYDNVHNPDAYAPVAELIAERLGAIDVLVGTVGSGGSMCGTAAYLRLVLPDLEVVGVDTHGSVIFGQRPRTRLLRGLGNSLMPGNVDHTAFDEVHWVSAAEAFAATRRLHRQQALFMGPTSGAAYMVAEWCARRRPQARIAVLMPDEGHRYVRTVYDDDWLAANAMRLVELPSDPDVIDDPHDAGDVWCRMAWGRARIARDLLPARSAS